MHKTFNSASHIITTSSQSTSLIPKKYRVKASESLGIALDDRELTELEPSQLTVEQQVDNKPQMFRVFYAGRFLHWKGMEFGLKAFAQLVNNIDSTDLTMIGDGTAKYLWQQTCKDMHINTNVHWVTKMSRTDFLESLKQFDVLLFPSLHDSGGMVVLEAMAAGIPVVCLDIGGPALLVDESCGIKVPATNQEDTTKMLYRALLELATDPKQRALKAQAAALRAKTCFTWKKKVGDINTIYESAVIQHNEN